MFYRSESWNQNTKERRFIHAGIHKPNLPDALETFHLIFIKQQQ